VEINSSDSRRQNATNKSHKNIWRGGSWLGGVFSLHQAPIDLTHPGALELNPVVKSNSCSGKNAGTLQHMLNSQLSDGIPTLKSGLHGIGIGVMATTTTGRGDQNPHLEQTLLSVVYG